MDKVVYKELSYKVCGLLYKTHNDLGRYKNEKQYGDYIEDLCKKEKINYKREFIIEPPFPGEKQNRNICDFIIENKLILELKAKRFINQEDFFQMKRYLSSTGLKLGLLVNFRQKYLTPRRVLNNEIKSTQ